MVPSADRPRKRELTLPRPPTLALITHEALGPRLAGPAIRALELARAMAPDVRAVLVTPAPGPDRGVEQRAYRVDAPATMDAATADADVLLVQGFTLFKFPRLAAGARPIVVDLYCPFPLENLERRRLVERDAASRAHAAEVDRRVLAEQLARGDYFLCASERQRDFYLGMLHALGRIDAAAVDVDPSAAHLIAVVPFGVDGAPPEARGPGLKGRAPGIAEPDRLILWGGSIADWHDPITPIRALHRIRDDHPDARLALPSGIPNPELPPMAALRQARDEARRLGLLDRGVTFFDWLPYEDRAAALLEADVGVSAHHPSLEARYAWRTRLLDCIWARLPIVCTRGDALAGLVEARGLGLAVEPGDVAGMAAAFDRLIADRAAADACRARAHALAADLAWPRVAAPLRAFCLAPRRSGRVAESASGPPLLARAAAALGWGRPR